MLFPRISLKMLRVVQRHAEGGHAEGGCGAKKIRAECRKMQKMLDKRRQSQTPPFATPLVLHVAARASLQYPHISQREVLGVSMCRDSVQCPSLSMRS